jgi:hypothetical protein
MCAAAALLAAGCARAASSGDGGAGDGAVDDGGPPDAPPPAATCEPCGDGANSGCRNDHVCVDYEGRSVCMPRCTPVVPDCPDGYLCGGAEVTFCAPTDGVCCLDLDGDEYGAGYECPGADCDDGDPDVHPGMPDRCNGVDDDCDADTDDGSNDSDVGVVCDGDDADRCEEGTTFCASGGAVACDDASADNPELCNGEDDDCDPSTADGVDADLVGTACDSPSDADSCLDDLYRCNSDLPAVECHDLAGSSIDICDGADNDCNGATADGSGDPLVGLSCDGAGDADLCHEGTTYCGGGQVLCDDPADADPDLCNGLDEDCNPATADGAGDVDVGVECDGADGDLCIEGEVLCAAGGVEQCDDDTATNVEICNGADDNCMSGVDEMNPDTSCPGQLPAAGNVADWACSGACVVVSCNALTADLDGWNANGCECTGLDTYGASCAAATAYAVALGATVTRSGRIETASGHDWLRFDFTQRAAPGTYHPRVQLTANGGGEFAMEVRTGCSTVASCGSGTGASVTVWEGIWDYADGAGCCRDDTPRVGTVWVHISRTNGAATCAGYTVVATNP